MPERRLPDGRIEIYEEPETLGFQTEGELTPEELLEVDQEVRQQEDETQG